jgi:hypothetical protein
MKFVVSFAAMLALAGVVSLSASGQADARCWKRCHGWARAQVVVPVVPVAPATEVVAVPAPNPIPRREPVPCCGAYVSYVYPSYTYPGVAYAPFGGCGFGWGGCYPRRDCWYDGYGRHFCN